MIIAQYVYWTIIPNFTPVSQAALPDLQKIRQS